MINVRSSYSDQTNFYRGNSPKELIERFGSPLYVYNEAILRERCREIMNLSQHDAFAVNYSVKANTNPHLIRIIREEGLRVDAMSPGEIAMDLMAGYEGKQILYISNNNDQAEMGNALDHGCLISVDSLSQLEQLGQLKQGAPVMLRFNPGIGAGHSAKVVTGGSASKFGIDPAQIHQALETIKKYELTLCGVNQHIGSLFMKPDTYLNAAQILLNIVDHLPAFAFSTIEVIDFGGGFGIPYHKYENEARLDMAAFGQELDEMLAGWTRQTHYGGFFMVEPGRYVVAECGALLGQATAIKQGETTRFVGTDIGFNVLMRPMLYEAWHDIEIFGSAEGRGPDIEQTIVGNICESGDILAKNRLLPPIQVGDIIAVLDAGAYGFSMASNYNERLLPAEVLLPESGEPRLIRRRQTIDDLKATLTGLD